jgi:hypothetical protein
MDPHPVPNAKCKCYQTPIPATSTAINPIPFQPTHWHIVHLEQTWRSTVFPSPCPSSKSCTQSRRWQTDMGWDGTSQDLIEESPF